MSSFAGSAFRALALGAFALFLVHSGFLTVFRVSEGMSQAAAVAGEDSLAVRRRELGSSYVLAIERLRRVIPRDGEYLLVRDVTEGDGGGAYWIRYELAPRRARFVGDLDQLIDGRPPRPKLPAGPRQVVIAFTAPRPPVVMDREELSRSPGRSHGGL